MLQSNILVANGWSIGLSGGIPEEPTIRKDSIRRKKNGNFKPRISKRFKSSRNYK